LTPWRAASSSRLSRACRATSGCARAACPRLPVPPRHASRPASAPQEAEPRTRKDRDAMTRMTRWSTLAPLVAPLLVLLGVRPARALEPTCRGGDITLPADSLAATRNGAGPDRVGAPSSSFVLPVGVSIDPASEAMSFVVEGDRRLLYQTDISPG